MFRKLFFKPFRRFSSATENERILSFKKKLTHLEYSASQLNLDPNFTRQHSKEELASNRIVKAFFNSPEDLEISEYINKAVFNDKTTNTPTNSWYQVTFPFEKRPELRSKFVRFYTNQVRIGRLLEILDYVASNVGYIYCYSDPADRKAILVTVCVDNLRFFKPLQADKDLKINAYPTYVGTSTIEIRTDMVQQASEGGKKELIASAQFLMAARDIKDHSKPYKVPQLTFENEAEEEKSRLRYDLGKIQQENRKKQSNMSLFKVPPSGSESMELHTFLMNNSSLEHAHEKNFTFIDQTQIEKTLLMHLQDRNLHGKVFGGYIMREAFELAWLAAYSFGQGEFPDIYHVDDVAFMSPIDIGSIVQFKAKVVYTVGNLVSVMVTADKIAPQKAPVRATEVHVTFARKSAEKTIIPRRYEDGLLYLEAKRRLNVFA